MFPYYYGAMWRVTEICAHKFMKFYFKFKFSAGIFKNSNFIHEMT